MKTTGVYGRPVGRDRRPCMTIFNVISLAGGLALFLYGMSIMGTGLEKYAGGRMESIL